MLNQDDPLIAELCRRHPERGYCPAAMGVIAGHDLCRDERIVVVVADRHGHELSLRLFYPASSDDDFDEARFLWFGPQEALCTPWHDGEPQCQVITVDLLRVFSAQWSPTV